MLKLHLVISELNRSFRTKYIFDTQVGNYKVLLLKNPSWEILHSAKHIFIYAQIMDSILLIWTRESILRLITMEVSRNTDTGIVHRQFQNQDEILFVERTKCARFGLLLCLIFKIFVDDLDTECFQESVCFIFTIYFLQNTFLVFNF